MELSAVDFIKTLGVSFAALFPIVNPVGDAPIFFGLTRNYPQSAQKVLARKIAAYGFVLLASREHCQQSQQRRLGLRVSD
jgi:multiple antibiotic resistance protein